MQSPESAAAGAPAAAESGPIFVDHTASAGLDFVHFNCMWGDLLLQEITCGAGALLDYDGDGDLDAYLLQGHMVGPGKTLDDATVPPRHQAPLTDRLYRNDLAFAAGGENSIRFVDVTAALAGAPTGYGCGVGVGDYDGDGWPDVYVANVGPNQLLRNQGDGTFRDVTAETGVGDEGTGVAAVFFDYDGDGWLDLFVGNNVTFDNTGATVCRSLSGAPDYCGPGAYPYQADRLYRNLGRGREGRVTFADATESTGLATSPPRPTLGAVTADFDGDGWVDLYVANDGQPNNLWLNRHDGTFSDEALLAGCAVNASGASEASMGVVTGDFDGDGDPDLFMTHLIKETNTLYLNDGRGSFSDATAAAGLASGSLPFTSFGTAPLDYDNDGRLDLLIVNGAVTLLPSLVAAGDPFPLHQTNQLFHNEGATSAGAPRFADVTDRAGKVFELSEVGRGLARGDVDNDGDIDALVINNGGPPRLMVNLVGSSGSWLGARPISCASASDALGARVTVRRSGGTPQRRRVQTDGSFSSAADPRLLFGMGAARAADSLSAVWPDGSAARWRQPPVGRYAVLSPSCGRGGGP